MSRCCFGIVGAVLNVSRRSQLCGLVSRGCRRDVSVLFQWCFSDVLVMFFVMSRFCLCGVSVMSR